MLTYLHTEISLSTECPSQTRSVTGLPHPLKIWGARGLGALGDLSANTQRVRDSLLPVCLPTPSNHSAPAHFSDLPCPSTYFLTLNNEEINEFVS